MFNVSDLNPEKLKLAFPHETIRIDGEDYLTRYYISGKNDRKIGEGRSIFLHQFHSSDQGRELHNHPYEGTSYILKGGYYEERFYKNDDGTFTDVTRTFYAPGETNHLPLNAYHRTDLNDAGEECWTLFITGERVKSWGFINRDTKQFFEYMDKSEERLGSGPHARDEIDGSIAARRAELEARMSRGSFAVGDAVSFSLYGEQVEGVVLEDVGGGRLQIGTKDGYRLLRRADQVKHSETPFVVPAGESERDNHGGPDKSWLKSFESSTETPVALAPVAEPGRPKFAAGDLVTLNIPNTTGAFYWLKGPIVARVERVHSAYEGGAYELSTSEFRFHQTANESDLTAYSEETESRPLAEGDVAKVSSDSGSELAGVLVKVGAIIKGTNLYVGNVYKRNIDAALVGDTLGRTAYIALTELTASDETFELYTGDSYGCPDRSWLKTAEKIGEQAAYEAANPEQESDDEEPTFTTHRKVGDRVSVDGVNGVIEEIDAQNPSLPFLVLNDEADYSDWRTEDEVTDAIVKASIELDKPALLDGKVVLVKSLYHDGDAYVYDERGNSRFVSQSELTSTLLPYVVATTVRTDTYGCPDRSWMKQYQEPKAIEAGFKVGTRVRLTSDYRQSYVGRTGVVRNTPRDGSLVAVELSNSRYVHVKPEQLVLV